ncbi:MAG: biotin-dependent carboxyltransferase family protein [Dermatophilaceae bacterium]
MTSRLLVRRTGPLTLVQDLGRPGHAAWGVPESGALDPGALRLANRLVGNDEHLAGLETTLGGLELRAEGAVVVAATGAPATLVVDGPDGQRRHGTGVAVRVPDGATVTVLAPRVGLRTWLAVRGGLRSPEMLGSTSIDLLSGLGAALAAGDTVAVGPPPAREVPPLDQAPLPARTGDLLVLRAVRGPRDDWFTEGSCEALTGVWAVSTRADRVGIHLEGEPLERVAERAGAELPSEGTVAGSVQVPTSGRPVLFLHDHPVTGGYPVIATVVIADLPLLAQAAPGARLRFRFVRAPLLP